MDQDTEKSPEDLRRLAVSQTPEENHFLTMVRRNKIANVGYAVTEMKPSIT